MALFTISDPNNPQVNGILSNPDPLFWPAIQSGAFFQLQLGLVTGSDNDDVLFDLSTPPSFLNNIMVSCRLDSNTGALNMWLDPNPFTTTFPFATLDDFQSAITPLQPGVAPTGTGTGFLTRSKKLPPNVNWGLAP